jgi:hypothetical protein
VPPPLGGDREAGAGGTKSCGAGGDNSSMNIIILGAGRVGESVAESLASEQNDITVIDTNAARLRKLEDRFDLRGVVGNGIQPSVLREAGAKDADMVIACAANDEANLVVCKIAHDVFNVPSTVARLRSAEFNEGDELLGKTGFAVDHVICPEESVTRYVRQLISYPEALQVVEFSQQRACLVGGRGGGGWATPSPNCASAFRTPRCASWRSTGSTPKWRPRHRPASCPATRSSCWPTCARSGWCSAPSTTSTNRCSA